jgi:ATP-grasp domain
VEGFARPEMARLSSTNQRILLIDEGWSQTIALARALELEGFRVTVATANGMSARTTRRTVEWISGPHVDSPDLIGWIDRTMDIGRDERTMGERAWTFDLIVPLTERLMARLWEACVPWGDRVFPSTDAWQRRVVRDKIALVDEMAVRGLPTLRQHRIGHGIDAAVRDLGFPLVVKGATGVGGERVRIVESRDELDRVLRRTDEMGGAWCLQEWAPGPTFLVGGVFDEGRALRLYAAEKLEQFPARVGPAIRLRSTSDARVRELGAAAIQELWWTGIASADVIVRRDGTLALLEINPRPWGSIAGAASAGVDVYGPLAELLRGGEPDEDLACRDGDDCRIFPRYLLAPRYRGVRGAVMAARDLLGAQGAEWRHPRFLVHVLGRLDRLSRGRGL